MNFTPTRIAGELVGLPQERVLLFYEDVGDLERITITEWEGEFVFEHYKYPYVLAEYKALYSFHPMLLQQAEDHLRTLGHTIDYPTDEDHFWLQPNQYEGGIGG